MSDLKTRDDLLRATRGIREALDRDIAAAGGRIEQPGSFEAWSFKDLIAHLTGWRLLTASRLEAPLTGTEPEFPWPDHLEESEEDLDEVNQWFYETNRDKPLDQVLEESNATFDRVERAIQQLPDDDLFTPGRFPWLEGTSEGLGPAVVGGSMEHYWEDHRPDIQTWLESDQ